MTLRNGLIGLAVVIVLALAGWYFFGRGEPASELVIETETAAAADIRRSVSATGTVRALVQVQVGSQLSGQIAELMVDFNSPVEEGQVIEFGRGSEDEVVARSEQFVRTLSQVTGRYRRPLLSADLRHTDGYALRLDGVATVTPATTGAR